MAIFEKITKFFKKPAFQGLPAPENGVTPAVPAAARPSKPVVRPATEPAPAPKTDTLSLRDAFLEELRSIPVRHTTADAAREDILKELRRINPADQAKP